MEDGAAGLLAAPSGEEFDVRGVTRIEHGHRLTLLGERQHIPESQALGVEAQAPAEVGCLDGDVVEPTAPYLEIISAAHVRPPNRAAPEQPYSANHKH